MTFRKECRPGKGGRGKRHFKTLVVPQRGGKKIELIRSRNSNPFVGGEEFKRGPSVGHRL